MLNYQSNNHPASVHVYLPNHLTVWSHLYLLWRDNFTNLLLLLCIYLVFKEFGNLAMVWLQID